ncbi:ion transporter [Microbulbifer agarilyticus]|uniref:Ion transporter n=1 Tax=Microbulbifer agarilyticus TaxID=260552 RepID=A0A1Q2M7W0_9GAMM|nr:ion channel [Microbulbifer agarilyticus]AQQ68377.1 ion transporter [Microbulbifer agarilyticus]
MSHRPHVLATALILAVTTFLFHAAVLLEFAHHMSRVHQWFADVLGSGRADTVLVTLCFVSLFITHVIEAALWGLFFWRKRLVPNFVEGVYFATSSITALGYGDVVLKPPWRMLGPLLAVNGLLIFGCSTAFLFLVLQKVWGTL